MKEPIEIRIGPRLRQFLDPLVEESKLRISYRLVCPPADPSDPEGPELIVDFDGRDASLLLAEDGELLRAFEYLAFETLRLPSEDHHRVIFDCQSRRQLRLQELRTLAGMAAERVAKNGMAYEFGPMNSRDRRMIHMAIQGHAEVRSESSGEGHDRHVVVRPLKAVAAPGGRKEYRRL